MDCITCSRAAGYNRAVVDILSGVEIGGLCVGCEHDEFGRSLDRGCWTDGDACAFCERDGHYALPRWEPRTKEQNGDVVCSVDYEIASSTLVLCDEHLHELRSDADEPTPWPTTPTTDTM